MYIFLSALLVVLFIVLTAMGESKRKPVSPRLLFFANLTLAAVGIVMMAAVYLTAYHKIFSGGFDEEFSSWAWDMFAVYYKISLIPCAAFALISAISSFLAVFDKKQRSGVSLSLRIAVTIVFSAVMLTAAPMYSFMTVNEKVPIEFYILVTGIGEALVLRAPTLIEYARRKPNAK